MKYRPEIDGIRTLAVLPVIIFHMGYSFLAGGYYGVDVFFVISGYLITSILTEKMKSNSFSMYEFWIRRIKRLLPLLIVVILTTFLVCPLIIFKPEMINIAQDSIPAIFSYFNFHALYNFGDYWGGAAEKSFFLHTWSLSVEEQFYLIYPFFLFFVYKYFKSFFKPLLVLTLISSLLFVFFIRIDREMTFYLLPMRVWELSAGGLSSIIGKKDIKNKLFKNLIPLIGVFFIFSSYMVADSKIDHTVFFSVLGTVMIIIFCNTSDFVGKLLSSKPFVYIGKLSYSMYLWHWPIIVFFNDLKYQLGISKSITSILIFFLTMILSYLSYNFIENKTRNYKYTPKLVMGGIVIIVLFSLYFQSSFFESSYKNDFKTTSYVNYFDISPKQIDRSKNTYNIHTPPRPHSFEKSYEENGIITIVDNKKPEILMMGDSHGVMWAKTIDEVCGDFKLSRSFYTTNGSQPFFNIKNLDNIDSEKSYTKGQRKRYATSLKHNIDSWNPKIFIIACKWESILSNEKTKQQFIETLEYLENRSTKILILNQPPVIDFIENNNANQYFTYLKINPVPGRQYVDSNNKSTHKSNLKLERIISKFKKATIYDANSQMIKGDKILISNNKDMYYYDDDHLSYEGTGFHKKNLEQVFKKILIN